MRKLIAIFMSMSLVIILGCAHNITLTRLEQTDVGKDKSIIVWSYLVNDISGKYNWELRGLFSGNTVDPGEKDAYYPIDRGRIRGEYGPVVGMRFTSDGEVIAYGVIPDIGHISGYSGRPLFFTIYPVHMNHRFIGYVLQNRYSHVRGFYPNPIDFVAEGGKAIYIGDIIHDVRTENNLLRTVRITVEETPGVVEYLESNYPIFSEIPIEKNICRIPEY